MPAVWPKEVREAVWAMRSDGKMPTEITRAINAGCDELNGIAYPVKRATVVAWLEKFYKDRGKPESNIAVGTELDVANAEIRTILTWARGKRKEVMARDGKLDADVATMTKVTALIARCEAAIREARVNKDQEKVDAGKTTKRPDRGILSRIAKAEQEVKKLDAKRRELPDDAASPDDASPEPQPRNRPDDSPPAPQSDPESDPYGTSGVGYPD